MNKELEAKLPESCYGVLSTDNTIIIIKRGETGYYKTDWPSTGIGSEAYQKAIDWAKELNDGLGVTPAQAEAMKVGSMFGWDVPGADPDHILNQKLAKNSKKDGEKTMKTKLTAEELKLVEEIANNWGSQNSDLSTVSIHDLGVALQDSEIYSNRGDEGYTNNVVEYIRETLTNKIKAYCKENDSWKAPSGVVITNVYMCVNKGYDKYLLFCIGYQDSPYGRDYIWGNGYSPDKGRWEHGHYNFENFGEALNSLTEFLSEHSKNENKATALQEYTLEKEGER